MINDPQDIPGLSHFIENQIINQYSKYQNLYELLIYGNLDSNTFCAVEEDGMMCFECEIEDTQVVEFVDMFSDSLVNLSFDSKIIPQQIEVIEQEYCKNLKNPTYKEERLLQLAIDQKHSESRIFSGN